MERDEESQVKPIYDQVISTLLGADKDNLTASLGDMKGESSSGGGALDEKGPLVALNKLQHAGVFDRIRSLNKPELSSRADDAQNYLRTASTNGKIGGVKTVGEFLDMLFGPNSTDTLGKNQWKSRPHTPTPQPEPASTPPPQQPQGPPQTPGAPPMPGVPPVPGMGAPQMPPKPVGGLAMA